jgi:DNA-binding MarR family transcriptional regulator
MQGKKQTTVDLMARECVANQLRMLSRVVTGIYEDELRPLKLTASQMVILALTAKRGQVRAAELCRVLQTDASTLSRNVERMRTRGWLVQASGEDERSRPFRLTASGERMLRDAMLAWERAQAKALDLVGNDGAAFLRRLTKKVRAESPPTKSDIPAKRRKGHGTPGNREAVPRPAGAP